MISILCFSKCESRPSLSGSFVCLTLKAKLLALSPLHAEKEKRERGGKIRFPVLFLVSLSLFPSLIFCFFSLSAPFHLSFLPFLYYCFAAAPVLDANTLFTSAYTFSGSLSASIFATFPFFS